MPSEQPSTDGRSGTLGALALGVDLANAAVLCTVRGVHEAASDRVRAVGDLVTGHPAERRTTQGGPDGGPRGGVTGLVYSSIGSGLGLTTRALSALDRATLDAGLTAPLETAHAAGSSSPC